MADKTPKKRSAVTHEEIVAAYEKLVDEGKQPSVRNITSLVGGSPSTIQSGIAKYKVELEEKSKLSSEANEILLSLGQQLVGLVRRENEKTTSQLKENIAELNETIESLQKEVSDLEHRSAEDRADYRTYLESKEKDLAVATDREERAINDMKASKAEQDKERELRHQAEIKVAALEAELKVLREKSKSQKL